MKEPVFLLVDEAAEILKVNRRTLTKLIEEGVIKAYDINRKGERRFYRIPYTEIMRIRDGSTK